MTDKDLENSYNEMAKETETELFTEENLTSPEVDEVKEKAKKYGYKDVSKEEWIAEGHDPEKYKTPEEFIRYGESYEVLKPMLDSLKKEISKRDKALDTLISETQNIREQEKNKLRAEIEYQLKMAKDMGNVDQVAQLAARQAQFEQEQQRAAINQVTNEMQAANEAFLKRNAYWFNNSPELAKEAIDLTTQYRSQYPSDTFYETARKVEEQIKYSHPEITNVVTPSRPVISANQSSVNKSSAPSSEREFRALTTDQKEEYKFAKAQVEKLRAQYNNPNKFTVQEFLAKAQKFQTNRGMK